MVVVAGEEDGWGGLPGVHCPLIPDVGKKGNEVCGDVKWWCWALQRRVIITFKEAQWRAFFVWLPLRCTADATITLSRGKQEEKNSNLEKAAKAATFGCQRPGEAQPDTFRPIDS